MNEEIKDSGRTSVKSESGLKKAFDLENRGCGGGERNGLCRAWSVNTWEVMPGPPLRYLLTFTISADSWYGEMLKS